MTKEVSIGQVHLRTLEADPPEVTPGGVSRISIVLDESAEFVGPGGKLGLCDPEGLNPTGLEVKVVMEPSWAAANEDRICVPMTQVGSGEVKLDYEITAPNSTGQHTVSAWLESTKQDVKSEVTSTTLTVSTGSGAKEDPDDDKDKDKKGKGLVDWAMNNPGPAVAVAGAGYLVLSKATETATEQVL